MAAEIGAPAPAFELSNVDREMVSSESFKGSKTLVVFIPNPFTGICDGETCALRDNLANLEALDAKVVIVTAHGRATNAEWAKQNGFEFPVLSDFWPHGEVSRAYGTFDETHGIATRSTYVLDADGIVRDIIATDSLGTAREYDAYETALAAI